MIISAVKRIETAKLITKQRYKNKSNKTNKAQEKSIS